MVEVAVKPAATDKSQESWDFPESESWTDHEKEVTGKLVASRNQEKIREFSSWKQKMSTSFSCISSSCTSHRKGLFDRTTHLRPKSNG